jgi:hypothetical protein
VSRALMLFAAMCFTGCDAGNAGNPRQRYSMVAGNEDVAFRVDTYSGEVCAFNVSHELQRIPELTQVFTGFALIGCATGDGARP